MRGRQTDDKLSLVSAGVAFYSLLALFPAIAAGVALFGLVASPEQLSQQLAAIRPVLPEEAYGIVQRQLSAVAGGAGGALTAGAVGSLLLTLWSASKGMKGLMDALSVAYDEEDSRGVIKQTLLALLFTFGGILFILVALAGVVAVPALVHRMDLPDPVPLLSRILVWPVLWLLVTAGIGLLYRYAPYRHGRRSKWLSPGAILASVLWLLASFGFSFYTANFAKYNETFGSLGAVVILLMWFFITAYVVLLGAELNAELEDPARKSESIPDRDRPPSSASPEHQPA